MPSWSASDPPHTAGWPHRPAVATAVERARRLLERRSANVRATTRLVPSSSQTHAGSRTTPSACATYPIGSCKPRARLDTRCRQMKLLISHPELAADLVYALNETDCLAARTALDTVRCSRRGSWRAATLRMPAPSCCSSSRPGRRVTRSSGRRCSTRARRRFSGSHRVRPIEVQSVRHGHATGRRDDLWSNADGVHAGHGRARPLVHICVGPVPRPPRSRAPSSASRSRYSCSRSAPLRSATASRPRRRSPSRSSSGASSRC